jgi:hypothetical protein
MKYGIRTENGPCGVNCCRTKVFIFAKAEHENNLAQSQERELPTFTKRLTPSGFLYYYTAPQRLAWAERAVRRLQYIDAAHRQSAQDLTEALAAAMKPAPIPRNKEVVIERILLQRNG